MHRSSRYVSQDYLYFVGGRPDGLVDGFALEQSFDTCRSAASSPRAVVLIHRYCYYSQDYCSSSAATLIHIFFRHLQDLKYRSSCAIVFRHCRYLLTYSNSCDAAANPDLRWEVQHTFSHVVL